MELVLQLVALVPGGQKRFAVEQSELPELELLGNTAQQAILALGNGTDAGESGEDLHRALHQGCELLLRNLTRSERVLTDLEEPGNSKENLQRPGR